MEVDLYHKTQISSALKWNPSDGGSKPNGTEPKKQEREMKEHFHQIIEIHHWGKTTERPLCNDLSFGQLRSGRSEYVD